MEKNPSLFDCIRFIICIEVVVHDINCSNNNVEIYIEYNDEKQCADLKVLFANPMAKYN